TIDFGLPSGKEIPIEERSPQEVLHLDGQPIDPKESPARNPAFDVTPAKYITGFITETGIWKPAQLGSVTKARLRPKTGTSKKGKRKKARSAHTLLPTDPFRDSVQLVTTWFGSFLLDEGTVVHQRLFPKDEKAIAERLSLVEDWKILPEERDLMALSDEVFVLEPRLERAGGNRTKERTPFLDPEPFGYGRDLLHAAMVR